MNEPVAFLWQVAWQLDPAVVGATAAVVAVAILLLPPPGRQLHRGLR